MNNMLIEPDYDSNESFLVHYSTGKNHIRKLSILNHTGQYSFKAFNQEYDGI